MKSVRADHQLTTLHRVLRGGRHVLLVPAAHAGSVSGSPALRPYHADLDIASGDVTHVVLVRPDGHVAARGRPGHLDTVTDYLRDLFSGPACHPSTGALKGVRHTRPTAPSQIEDPDPAKPELDYLSAAEGKECTGDTRSGPAGWRRSS